LRVRNIGRGSTALTIGLMFLLVFLVHLSQVPCAHPWGWSTHQFVAQKAIELMPDNSEWFFSTYSSVIIEYSVKPDQWKGSDPNESYRHWYHVDHPHDESQYWDGVLPWAVEDNFNMFVQFLRENNWSRAAQLAGVISHYIGDASNPLHATSDYTPGGNHGAFESTVDSHLGEMNMDMPGFVPQELENVFNSTMQLLDDSYSCTIVLNPYLESGILWNDEIKDMTEERLRASAQLHANIWYTGMILAMAGPTSSVTSITPYWQTSIPFTITATASAGVQGVSLYHRYSIDNSSWSNWTFFGTDNSSPYSWSFTAPQGDGYYEFYSIARDGAGNEEPPPAAADARCSMDKAAPASSVNTISPYWQTSTSFQITAMASDATSGVENVSLYHRYSTDNSSWSNWALYGMDTAAPWEWSFIAPSGSGYCEFYSIAVDRAGNVEQAPTEADARCGVETIVRGVEVRISPSENEGSPGETLAYTITVKNLGNVQENLQLTKGDNAGWTLSLDDDWLLVPKGENRMMRLTVRIPSNARGCTWDNIWVKATLNDNTEVFDNKSCLAHVRVARGVDVSISPENRTGRPEDNFTFIVTVKNTGEDVDTYDLTASDDAGWGAWLDENLLTVLADENTTVTVSVTIPSDAVEGDSTTITVTAASRENAQVEDSATCTATATNAPPPRYLVPIAVGGVVVGGGVAVALLLKKGIIHFPS